MEVEHSISMQYPSEQNCQKYSLKECVFVNSILKIQCRVVKSTLLQIAFSTILPTGIVANKLLLSSLGIEKDVKSIQKAQDRERRNQIFGCAKCFSLVYMLIH